jgi:transcriptional regulator with XRE-family HTH domain
MNSGRDLLERKIRDLDLTQAEAARKAGVSQSLLSRILGGRSQPSVETAFKIEQRLGIPARSWCHSGSLRRASGGPKRKGDASPASDGERRVA